MFTVLWRKDRQFFRNFKMNSEKSVKRSRTSDNQRESSFGYPSAAPRFLMVDNKLVRKAQGLAVMRAPCIVITLDSPLSGLIKYRHK